MQQLHHQGIPFLSEHDFASGICEIYISNYISPGTLFIQFYIPRILGCAISTSFWAADLLQSALMDRHASASLLFLVIIFKFLDKLSTASMPKADCCIRLFIRIYSVSALYRDCQSIINLADQISAGNLNQWSPLMEMRIWRCCAFGGNLRSDSFHTRTFLVRICRSLGRNLCKS